MGVEDLHRRAVHLHLDPQGAARLKPPDRRIAGQGADLHHALGEAGQDRVAVLLLLDPQRGVEVAGHVQPPGDLVGLVHVAGSGATHVQLLHRHDVRLQGGQHLGHAADVQPPVVPDAAMHIVGDDPGHGSGVHGFCGGGKAEGTTGARPWFATPLRKISPKPSVNVSVIFPRRGLLAYGRGQADTP